MFVLFGCVSRLKLHLLNRKEKYATGEYIAPTAVVASRAVQSSVAGAATTAVQGTAGRHAASLAASPATSSAAAADSWPALIRATGSGPSQAGPAGARASSRPTGYAAALRAPPTSPTPAGTALQHVQQRPQRQQQQQQQRPQQQHSRPRPRQQQRRQQQHSRPRQQQHRPRQQQQQQMGRAARQQSADLSVSGGLSEGASGSGDAVRQDRTGILAQPETLQVNLT